MGNPKLMSDAITIENEHLKVTIKEKGAELNSIINKEHRVGIYVERGSCVLGKDLTDLVSDCRNLKKRYL